MIVTFSDKIQFWKSIQINANKEKLTAKKWHPAHITLQEEEEEEEKQLKTVKNWVIDKYISL